MKRSMRAGRNAKCSSNQAVAVDGVEWTSITGWVDWIGSSCIVKTFGRDARDFKIGSSSSSIKPWSAFVL